MLHARTEALAVLENRWIFEATFTQPECRPLVWLFRNGAAVGEVDGFICRVNSRIRSFRRDGEL